MSRSVGRLCFLGFAVTTLACVARPNVDRAYAGTVVRGRFIEPHAYAAFLRGAMSEASGQPSDALAAYSDAERLDTASPEIETRLGAIRCRMNPRDAAAQTHFARAESLDPLYEPVRQARAQCAQLRSDAPALRAGTAAP